MVVGYKVWTRQWLQPIKLLESYMGCGAFWKLRERTPEDTLYPIVLIAIRASLVFCVRGGL